MNAALLETLARAAMVDVGKYGPPTETAIDGMFAVAMHHGKELRDKFNRVHAVTGKGQSK
jgi:hypothetical protein